MNTSNLAPIVLFVYNRPWHTRQTLEALANNHMASESLLYIFADGPKSEASAEEITNISEVRKITKEKQWCKNVELIVAKENKGLAQAVIDGVTKIVNQYGRVIVLEDDLITSPWFLTFMNEGLEVYKDVQNVYSVNGYMFPIETNRLESVLLPYPSTWGWATWKEKWSSFKICKDESEVLAKNPFLRQRFNLAEYDYTTMLLNAKHSWGIHWYYSVFKRNGLGVFPTKTLVSNTGFDGSGVNCGNQEVEQKINNTKVSVQSSNVIDFEFYSDYLIYFKKKKRSKLFVIKLLLLKVKKETSKIFLKNRKTK